jgi:penicillin-binding protein 2
MPENNQKHIVFNIVLILSFVVLIFKLFHMQVYESRKYLRYSEQNRIRRLQLQPPRGMIYDRNDEVLVDNRPSYSLSAIPFECNKSDSVIHRLSKVLDEPSKEIKARLKEAESPFTPMKIRRDVDFTTLVKIEERKLDFPGVVYDVEPKRNYPAQIKAPHVFGYLGEISKAELAARKAEGLQQGDIVGKRGLEKLYDSDLRGRIGYNFVEVDALGREVKEVSAAEERNAERGKDFHLTIDARLQRLAEELYVDKLGGVVMIDVKDGGILTLCSKPDYDPEVFTSVLSPEKWRALINDPTKPLYDRMLQSLYPPGSTFKLVLVAAALETQKADLNTSTVCTGYVNYGVATFKCWKSGGHGHVALLDAIKVSCNSFFYRLSLKVGLDAWSDFARRFGFGQPTGIDLLGESAGNVPDKAYLDKVYGKNGWTNGNLLNLGIGQGDLLVTPLQMAQFAMILANHGTYFQPHLIQRVYNPETHRYTIYNPKQKKVEGVSENTYSVMAEGMYKVVNEPGGTGRASFLTDFKVAGKTGTAQNPHGEPHAWFIGFAPYENPQVAICVLLENGGGGGANAAPIAGKLFRRYFDDRMPQSPMAQADVANRTE